MSQANKIEPSQVQMAEKSPQKKSVGRQRRASVLIRQDSGMGGSAKQLCSEFCRSEKKDIDPEKMKKVNVILRRLICEQWCLLIFALPLSFLGSIQEFTTPYFIGEILDTMSGREPAIKAGTYNGEDDGYLNRQILLWVGVLITGSLFASIKDYLYAMSSERLGKRAR